MLSMVGKWSIFAVDVLQLGDYAGNPRTVTEEVHRFNAKTRNPKDYEEVMRRENEARLGRRMRNRQEARRWTLKKVARSLKMKILDVKSFFVCVPRKRFRDEVLPDVMKRMEGKFPGRPYF